MPSNDHNCKSQVVGRKSKSCCSLIDFVWKLSVETRLWYNSIFSDLHWWLLFKFLPFWRKRFFPVAFCWWWCKETIDSKQFGAKILILYISCDAKTWSFLSYDKECLTGCIFFLSHPSQTNTNVKKKQMLLQQNSYPPHIFRMQSLKVLWGKLPFPPILHHLFSHHCHHPVSKLDIVNIFYSFEEKVVAPEPSHSSSYQKETEVMEFLSPDVTFDKILLELWWWRWELWRHWR